MNYTLFSPEPNDVIYCLLLSRVITEPNFNYISGGEINIYGGAYPIPSSNHLCSTHIRLRYVFQNLLSISAINVFGKLKIDGKLVVKSKVPPCSGSVALRQLNPVHKKGP